jgi:hypothetical protein
MNVRAPQPLGERVQIEACIVPAGLGAACRRQLVTVLNELAKGAVGEIMWCEDNTRWEEYAAGFLERTSFSRSAHWLLARASKGRVCWIVTLGEALTALQ